MISVHVVVAVSLLGFALAGIAEALPVECDMQLAFEQKDKNAPGGMTPVWSSSATEPKSPALMFIEKINVNTDGTHRSYNVSDFWGEQRALNNLCNAMSDACVGLDTEGLRQRRILTQQARAQGWPRELTERTRIDPHIIPFKDGKPCPEIDGYLVSATALHRPTISDVCDMSNYLDALVTPAIVLPKGNDSEFAHRNARIGDLAVALRPGSTVPVFAVIGDYGPSGELGEGSIALNGRLLGKTTPPDNYREVRGKAPYHGKAWVVPATFILIFPGTRNVSAPFMTSERIDPEASRLFERWGGLARAHACINAYRR